MSESLNKVDTSSFNEVSNLVNFVKSLDKEKLQEFFAALKADFQVSFDIKEDKVEFIFSLIKTLNVMEAAKLVEMMETTFGFSISQMMSSAAANSGGSSNADGESGGDAPKNAKKQLLVKAGGSGAKAIMALRKVNKTLALGDAKKLLEEGGVLASDLDEEQCKEFKKHLEGVVEFEEKAA